MTLVLPHCPLPADYFYVRLEPVRTTVPDKIEVVCRPTYRFRMDCFKLVITDRCGNELYSQPITTVGVDDPCFVWNNILTPPPAASPPMPPDVPTTSERASSI